MKYAIKEILIAVGALLIVPTIAVLFLVAPRWALGTAVACCGLEAEGVVESKREAVEFNHENWRHRTEVTVRYRPEGAPSPETFTQQVEPAVFDALQIGEPVRVRYTGIAKLRSFANGAGLVGTSLASRESIEHGFWGDILDAVYLGVAFSVFVMSLAFFKSTRLRWIGVVAVAATASAAMKMGWLVIPALFLIWRKLPGVGFGRALLATIPLMVLVLALRVPWPAAAPTGPVTQATATVAQVKTIDRIWANRGGSVRVGVGGGTRSGGSTTNNGTEIDAPFLMVDVQFTPPGAHVPVHAVDRIDKASAPALAVGSTVRVEVPRDEPRAARLLDVRRNFGLNALWSLVLWNAWMCLVGLPLVWPLVAFGMWMARAFGFIPSAASAKATPAAAATPTATP